MIFWLVVVGVAGLLMGAVVACVALVFYLRKGFRW